MARTGVVVLDTHAWLWLTDEPSRLSERAQGAIESASEVLVSSISAWELAVLSKRNRIRFDRTVDDWVDQALHVAGARLIDVDLEIALRGAELMEAPLDPADALVAATALAFDASLVTRDRRLADIDALRVMW